MNLSSPLPEPLACDPFYPHLKQHLIEATGLAYYADKSEDLARRIGRRLSSLGLSDCASYMGILRDSVRGPSEWDALMAEITIGETHLFRHKEQFDALRDQVLPDAIARNRSRRSLRIWSAGCATGAEAYSVAILLRRELAHHVAGWDVTVLGTDINRHCIAQASEGRFDEYAFRATPEDLKRDCFLKDEKRWRIGSEYKKGVSFQYHNLVEHSFPSLANNLFAFDLIICRNVLIYFGPDLMQKVIGQFHDCLVPNGWLLVGPAEPNMTHFTSFRTVNAPGVTLYQRSGPEASKENPFAATAVPAALSPIPCAPRSRKPAEHPATTPEPSSESARLSLADVRQQADRGEWEKSARSCEELLDKDNLNSAAHFYYALILEQMNRYAEAEQSLRRAIYLDRQFILAHYHLGLFLQRRGDPRRAVRSFENALVLLEGQCAADILAEGDGITVAELTKSAKIHIETLQERV
jgi:chemotaxis protein methyltransferase CheR